MTFNHHSVFPVLFNAMTINQWIRLTAVFTVYYQSKEDGKVIAVVWKLVSVSGNAQSLCLWYNAYLLGLF